MLEMVLPKVKERISNLNLVPWATKRFGKDYKSNRGKLSFCKYYMDKIINLTPVKGNSFDKVTDLRRTFKQKLQHFANPGRGGHVEGVCDDATEENTSSKTQPC